MAEYIKSRHDGKPLCHPRTVGLTGVGTLAEREAAVKVAARAYRCSPVPLRARTVGGSSAARGAHGAGAESACLRSVYYNPTNDDDEHYLVDHSIISYLLAPDGSLHRCSVS